jgi:aquaporin Z
MLRSLRTHWPEYLIEAACLAAFMISANLILSPWGKRSGAHMNPSTTLTFYRLGRVAPWDAVFYVAAQFAGAIAGTLAAAAFLGQVIAHPSVDFVVTRPGSGGPCVAFAAELAMTFVLMTTILVVSNTKRLARHTALFAGALIALYITVEAPLSGTSLNPARTFGSAFAASRYTALWVYFAAPLAGMLLAAEAYARLGRARVAHCAKLHHENDHPCIFLCRYGELR